MSQTYGTVRNLLYPSSVTSRDEPEYLGNSTHRWNASTGAVETWLSDVDVRNWAKGGGDYWYVAVEWHLVAGTPTPTSFECHSSKGRERDQLKPITRDLTKRLPLGQVVTHGLEQLLAYHDGVTRELKADSPERHATSDALRSGRSSRMEDVYRLAYKLNSTAREKGHRHPSRWAWEQLSFKGITDARGESPSYEVVRTKWIPKGKALATRDSSHSGTSETTPGGPTTKRKRDTK